MSPTPELTAQMRNLPLTPATIDSLVAIIRFNAVKNTHTKSLVDTKGTPYIAGVFVPDSFAHDSLYPLIVYLHGGIGTRKNTKGEAAYNMLRPLADSMTLFLVSPSGNRQAPWWSDAGMRRILQTLRYMTVHYPIDPDRIILAGVSDGATGCYAAANWINGPFAGFIAVSGFGGMLTQLGVKLHFGNLMQRPIRNVNGGQDHLYSIEHVQHFVKWLKSNGVAIAGKVYPDQPHGFDYREKEMSALTEFVRTHHRPKRTGVSWVVSPGLPNLTDNIVSFEVDPRSSGTPQVAGFWREDTLTIQAQALNKVRITRRGGTGQSYWTDITGTTRRAKMLPLNTTLQLDILQSLAYPGIPQKTVLEITFPK